MLACLLLACAGASASGQAGQAFVTAAEADQSPQAPAPPTAASGIWSLRGLQVDKIEFEGVTLEQQQGLIADLPVHEGQVLDPAGLQETTRRLYASGLYRNIELRGVRHGDAVTLIFYGSARFFVGRIEILGVSNERLTSILEYATQLQPGTPFQQAKVAAGADGIRQSLQQNGYYTPTVTPQTRVIEAEKQVDVSYTVQIGPQARVGQVDLSGEPGMTLEEFRKRGKLKEKTKVNRDTVSNAFTRLRKRYQKNDRLEATIALEDSKYNEQRKQLDYKFNANQGPLVKVETVGDKLSTRQLKKLVPIYEESAVDNDLINEGSHNIKESLQRKGYFDAEVTSVRTGAGTQQETVTYTIHNNRKHKVIAVDITGNKYFDLDTLKERMQVVHADAYNRVGRYSQQLLAADVAAIQALYRANGFSQADVKTDVQDVEQNKKSAQIRVKLTVVEGPQQKFGEVALNGVDPARKDELRGLMNAQQGQPYSLITLSGDRDAVLGYYLSHGFDQARVDVHQAKANEDGSEVNVSLDVTEGEQVFVDKVLVSGALHTKAAVVQRQIELRPNEPLDQSALLNTQRNLYNLALFSEVNTAVQNPDGRVDRKNVLVQMKEAKRWDVTYGFGFEVQTGTPQTNCNAQLSLNPNADCRQEGKAGVSPRVSLDVTRINLRGTDQSLTMHVTYGLLEQIATATFSLPHFRNKRSLDASISGGYSNVRNISTYASKQLQGSTKLTQRLSRADTVIYDFTYRRVTVDQSSLQITANLIPLLSQPVKVGGPGLTFLHDTRQPSPLDASKGLFLSVQNFFSNHVFGSDVDFNRTDITNSTYYAFGKKSRYVFARNTRFGFISTLGPNPQLEGNSTCAGQGQGQVVTDPSCIAVPLPERLYAGGATSHRGFPINGAGPRDLTTGYPVGGDGVFVNTFELRMPGPVLPIVNDNLQVVLFHDMGNAFINVSDIWKSFGRFRQPNESTCKNFSVTKGVCDFNYFSHALGMGARYKTPVGPLRVDFSYNLNPPYYPVINDYSLPYPLVHGYSGRASHFNFFFSIGQTF
ncbi:POTRA domain-containing protein [Terriglobus tenax]|uniref:POTRA domain-containing protein n=1 Tax=Terriglobus tenax TaxID=1111115 RepID=UPI0021E02BC1|nr:POTRA domain-containing protein [Terriglobus tenax]